jgi:mono/diheme cytochrome c family protein
MAAEEGDGIMSGTNGMMTKKIRLLSVAFILAGMSSMTGALGQSMQIPKPSEGLMPNPGKGKVMYATHCASCHGADLKGSDKGPPMLHKVYEPSHHSDVAFQLAVKKGTRAHHWKFGDMAPVPGLTPDDVAHITAFIRFEQRKVGIQ